jgi:hypothetical protein
MKAITLFLVAASLCSMRLFAQDTLYTKTGSVVNAKVVEIGQDQIKYKKASNPDGPLYVMNTSDLVLIHFKNGSKEVFSSSDGQAGNSVQNNSPNGSNGNQPTVVNNYSSFPSYTRPGVNVVVAPTPYWGYNPWWRWGGFYRPFYGYGGYYHHGYGGGYYHGGGGHYGHHR